MIYKHSGIYLSVIYLRLNFPLSLTDRCTECMNFILRRTWVFSEIRYVMIDTKFHFFLLTRYCFMYPLSVGLRNWY
jgi:hypothetical protein